MEEKDLADAFQPISDSEQDLIAEAAQDPVLHKTYPTTAIGNPNPVSDAELWRCFRCGGGIRTNADIQNGKMCPRCRSTHVCAAIPTWWETIKLFFRTGKIYLAEKEAPDGGED